MKALIYLTPIRLIYLKENFSSGEPKKLYMSGGKRTPTSYHPRVVQESTARECYEYLASTIPWEISVPSRKEPGVTTRLGCLVSMQYDSVLSDLILNVLRDVLPGEDLVIHQIYLNWYRNGHEYCPNHSHSGSRQLVISLGATRTLKVGQKNYSMSNGDAIVFGRSLHGIPREVSITEGRISIAVFLDK